MKIISFVAIKGGVGKTTLTYNYGSWLAAQGKKVLLIDLDHQCNLTQTFDIYNSEHTVENIFRGGEVEIVQVTENIAVLPGYMQLDSVERELETDVNKNLYLYNWLYDNYERKNLEQYDYVLIDCHPDFSVATKNAVIVSHSLISPLIPSRYGYNAKYTLEERLERYRGEQISYPSRESLVTAKLFFLGNKIRHNTNSSHELLKTLETDEGAIGFIPDKELFNRSTRERYPLSEMKADVTLYRTHKRFFDELDKTFQKITNMI